MCASRAGLRGKELLLAGAGPGGGRHVEEDHVVVGRPEGGHEGDRRDRDPRAGVGATEREAAEGGAVPPPAAGGVAARAEGAAVRPEGTDEHPPAGVTPSRGRRGPDEEVVARNGQRAHVRAAAVRDRFATREAEPGTRGERAHVAAEADRARVGGGDHDRHAARLGHRRVPHDVHARGDGAGGAGAAHTHLRRADVAAGAAVVGVGLRVDAGAAAHALPRGAGAGARDAALTRGAAVAAGAAVRDARRDDGLAAIGRVAVAVAEARVAGTHDTGARRTGGRRVDEGAGSAAHAAVRATRARVDLAPVHGAAVAVREARVAGAHTADARGAHGGGVRQRRARVVAAAAVGGARTRVDAAVAAALLERRAEAPAGTAGADRPERAPTVAAAAVIVVVLRVDAGAAAARLPDGAGLGTGVDGDVERHHVGAVVRRDVRPLRVGRIRTRVEGVGTHHVRPVRLDVGHEDVGPVDGDVGPVVGSDRAVARVHAGFGGRGSVSVGRGSVRASVESVVRDDVRARAIALHIHHRHVHERRVGRGFTRVRRTVLRDRAVQGRNPGHPGGRGGRIRHSAAAHKCGQRKPSVHEHHLRRSRQLEPGPQTRNCETYESPNGRTSRPAQIYE